VSSRRGHPARCAAPPLPPTRGPRCPGLRFVVYSALLSRHLARVPLLLRLGTCFLAIDGPLVVLMQAPSRGLLGQRVALLNGANLVTAAAWCGSSVLGIPLAARVTLRARSFVLQLD